MGVADVAGCGRWADQTMLGFSRLISLLWLGAFPAPALTQAQDLRLPDPQEVPAVAASAAASQAVSAVHGASAPAAQGAGYRFPAKVVVPNDRGDVSPFVFYAHAVSNGAPVLATDGQAEPFVIRTNRREAVGVFSGKRIVASLKTSPGDSRGPNVLDAAHLAANGQGVSLRYCCQYHVGRVAPPEAFPESEWSAMEAMRESLQLFTPAERGRFNTVKDCAGVEFPTGYLGQQSPSLALRWRHVYVVDERVEMTRCTGYLNVTSGARVGDPLGDGSRLLSVNFQSNQAHLVFRVDERTGLPIGALPAWISVVGVDELVAFRAAFRDAQGGSGKGELHCDDEGFRECYRMIDAYQKALLEHFFHRKKPRRL